jgi:CDP-diacylglycerol--glycerol-3-phosphate 3-phosphatidyltransferase
VSAGWCADQFEKQLMVGIYQVKPAFQRSLRGIEDQLVTRRVHPDSLTFAALALSVSGGICLYFAPHALWLLAPVPIICIVRTALNALDGLVAKRTGLARPWGEVLNEVCDRLADVALLGGLALAAPSAHLIGATTVVAVLLTSYLGVLAKAAGARRQYGGPMGKADRMVLLALTAVIGLFLPLDLVYNAFLVVVLVGVGITFISRARSTHRELRPSL